MLLNALRDAPSRSLLLASTSVVALFGVVPTAYAACVTDAKHHVTCDGVTAIDGSATQPVTLYDPAAQVQPVAGSNAYTPTSYAKKPAPVEVTINKGASITGTVTSANSGTVLSDKGFIAANYSNAESPAVNSVVVNNFGSIALINQQFATRAHAIVADSQVKTFTVKNNAGASISVAQTATGFGSDFAPAGLLLTSSGSPATYTARYLAANKSLNITSGLYSDDNTEKFVVNNAGAITATGHYAAAYYGRAATTITNTGTLGNTDWKATDKLSDGHWAIGTYAGADFKALTGSNPDTPIYVITNGAATVTDTAKTVVKNSGTIFGDILVLDTNPLVAAAATATNTALPLAVSASNSGPRDSKIVNSGTINGNLYLGSGAHDIQNNAGAAINGSINVDQRASVGSFASSPTPGTVAGTYLSTGSGTDSKGAACPAANSNTTDLYCAKSTSTLAAFNGDRTFKLANEGKLTGDVTINDQAGATNTITLTGKGFTGNIVALNGTGSNSLTLNGVTRLTSVRNFSSLNLGKSQVTVTNGVTLVSGAKVTTTIFGDGGTKAAPSREIGSIYGTLTLAGPATLSLKNKAIVQDGDTYQVATAVNGAGAGAISTVNSALVKYSTSTTDGRLLVSASVRDVGTVSGVEGAGLATLRNLFAYNGDSDSVRTLGGAVQMLKTDDQVRAAAGALAPVTNGAATQSVIGSIDAIFARIDSRLDSFTTGLVPASGRSADLGVRPIAPEPPRNGAWIEALGGGAHQSGVGGQAGYTSELEGFVAGADRLVGTNLRLGAAFGFVNTQINGNTQTASQGSIQTYQGLAYASYDLPRVYVRGTVGFGGLSYSNLRRIDFAGFSDVASSRHRGRVVTARGESGLPLEMGMNLLVPYAAFTYARIDQDAYSEQSGAGAALTYASNTTNSARSEAGAKLVAPLTSLPLIAKLFPVGSALALEGRAAYVHEFASTAQTVAASFTGGNLFVATGPAAARDMADYGVGLRMVNASVQIDLGYEGLARANYLQQIGFLRARYVF